MSQQRAEVAAEADALHAAEVAGEVASPMAMSTPPMPAEADAEAAARLDGEGPRTPEQLEA